MSVNGLEVTVVSSPGPELEQFGDAQNVPTIAVPMRRAISPGFDLYSLVSMILKLRELRPQIVHAHTPKGGLVGMIASRLSRVPVRIYHIRGLPYMTSHGLERRLLRWSEKLSCGLADEVFCVSHSIREVAIGDGVVSAKKVRVFGGGSGNGVDASCRYNPDSYSAGERDQLRGTLGIYNTDTVIGFVGRLVRDKGVEDLAKAWKAMSTRYPNVKLVLVGPQETKDAISDETRNLLESDPRVKLIGDVSDSAPYYSICDVVTLPTYREGFPNVPLEAAAMEVPVVASRIPGCVDAIQDGVTGTLVPPGDVEALQGAIERYLDDPILRRAHGLAGRRRVLEQFRQEHIWQATYLEYCQLLEQKGLPVPSPSPSPSSERKF